MNIANWLPVVSNKINKSFLICILYMLFKTYILNSNTGVHPKGGLIYCLSRIFFPSVNGSDIAVDTSALSVNVLTPRLLVFIMSALP